MKRKVDFGGGDSVAGARDRRLHIGFPADRRSAAAAFARRSRRNGCTPSLLSRRRASSWRITTYDSCSYPMFLRMRADVKEQAESMAISHVQRPRRSDLWIGPGDGERPTYSMSRAGCSRLSDCGRRAGRLLTENDDSRPARIPTRCCRTTIGRAASGGSECCGPYLPHGRRRLFKSSAWPRPASPARRPAGSQTFSFPWR